MKKITLLFIALVLHCGWGVNASVSGDSVQYDVVTVEENDTLWDIAARRVDNTKDIRQVIYDIEQFNTITNPGQLEPGMKIKIPVDLEKYKSLKKQTFILLAKIFFKRINVCFLL